MKLTLGQIKEIYSSFLKLKAETKFSLATRWSIKQVVKPVENFFHEIEKLRLQLIDELGQPDANGTKTVTTANLPKFVDEMELIYKKEVELPDLSIQFKELEKAEYLSGDDLDKLEIFIANAPEAKAETKE